MSLSQLQPLGILLQVYELRPHVHSSKLPIIYNFTFSCIARGWLFSQTLLTYENFIGYFQCPYAHV